MSVSLQGISKRFGFVEVLRDFSLEIADGEFVCFFCPNACGKTTLLLTIAGLEKTDAGIVRINGKPPSNAKAGFVFQDYNASLFPWRTAEENVAYAIECSNGDRNKARMLLEKLGVPPNRFPYELSGGMRQRVCLARALAYEPDVLLLDEPFSNLDFDTRLALEEELVRLWLEKKQTVACVSHDVDEAVYLADRVVVLSPKPAKVKAVVEVSLSRPRCRTSREFFFFRKKVLEAYRA